MSIPRCDAFIKFINLSGAIVTNDLPDTGNGFGIRAFGDLNSSWMKINYRNRKGFMDAVNNLINGYTNNCGLAMDAHYNQIFTDILDNLDKGYRGYGIFLAGETDTLADLSVSLPLAQQIASRNTDVYVWDFSVNNNNNTLFETLTSGKPGHILKGLNRSYEEIYSFASQQMLPEFRNFACGVSHNSNTSCSSLELIFILDRAESVVPSIYNGNVPQFVIDLASQFTFPDESTSENPGYIRLGVIQFGETAEVTIPLGNYSRSDFINRVNTTVNMGSNSGEDNVVNGLLAAYNQFSTLSSLPNRAVILVADDLNNYTVADAQDAMAKLKNLVSLPMGVVIPGTSGSDEEAFEQLKLLFGNDSKYVFPDLTSASSGIPGLVSEHFPCQGPPVCSVILFIEESTTAIGHSGKMNFLLLVRRLLNTVIFNPNQRFSLSFFGGVIYKGIEPQPLAEFNATLEAAILNMDGTDKPNSGQNDLTPILNQTIYYFGSGLYKHFSVLLIGETEALIHPSSAFNASQIAASYKQDIYVIDQSRYAGPSSLYPTLTGNKPGHVLNGTSLSQDALFETLRDSMIKDFNLMTC
ncbi:hypothetical protein FO519_002159 [Halicephalobus sp. NKZ332]|nr:hypothetical protein FO519_002159 [Halicephalobus sp. NKZ332]